MLALVALESGTVSLVLAGMAGFLRWILLGILLAAILVLLSVLVAPLFTGHTLTENQLRLRLGWIELKVPLEEVEDIEPVVGTPQFRFPIKMDYESEPRRVRLNFTRNGLLRLRLRREIDLRLSPWGAPKPVLEILFDVKETNELLTALGTRRRASSKP